MHQEVEVSVGQEKVEVIFQIETNEEARLVEAIAIDSNSDGQLTSEEQARYFAQLDARLREGLQVVLNEQVVPLYPAGEVNLSPPARKVFRFRGDVPSSVLFPANLQVYNDNFLDWPGRNEVLAGASEGLRLAVVDGVHHLAPDAASGVLQVDRPNLDAIIFASVGEVDWSHWSWIRRLLSRLCASVIGTLLGVIACVIVLAGWRSLAARVVATVLAAASLVGLLLAFVARSPAPTASEGWVHEFRMYHRTLSSAIGEYHARGDANSLRLLMPPATLAKLTASTRVTNASDERSETFEIRRVKPISTTILDEPRYPLHSTLRVRHTWRAIGIMKHDGHPHERIRDFTCDYTLRATDRGLKLIECSDWHQLPDEPIEE